MARTPLIRAQITRKLAIRLFGKSLLTITFSNIGQPLSIYRLQYRFLSIFGLYATYVYDSSMQMVPLGVVKRVQVAITVRVKNCSRTRREVEYEISNFLPTKRLIQY